MSDPGRNDLCHCGSEKKYKKCCLDRDREVARGERPAATIDGSRSPTVKDGHIVPRMYQAAWEDEKRRVAVHGVDGGECRLRSTKSVTTRGAYYRRIRPEGETSDDVEDSLRRIEDKASDPLRRLIAGDDPGGEDKGILAQLFSIQLFRSPTFFSQREKLIRTFFESAGTEAFTPHGLRSAGGDLEVIRQKAIDAYLDPTKKFVTMIAYGVKVASILGLMRWQVLRAEEPVLAYSDHPIVLWPIDAPSARPFKRQGSDPLQTLEIVVPISPEAAVLMNWIDRSDDGAVPMPEGAAPQLNAFVTSQAEEEWMHKPGAEPVISEGTFRALSRMIDATYDARAASSSQRHHLAETAVERAQKVDFVNDVDVLVEIPTGCGLGEIPI
jgi:hypothetical protein